MATVKKSHVTEEEENYLRMNLLLTSISPRAVRVLFDKEFHPSCLVETFKKERVKLYDLKNRNHVINAAQLNLLFPKRGYPHSKNFDVTLMIALLRNLTDLPAAEYEKLPKSTDITQTADLARIKHYRNHLAHMEGVQIMSTFFNTAWEDICGAVGRLGGQNMTQECETLRKRCLDQSTIPWHIRLQISKELEQWRMFDINFVKTLGAQKVLECIKENSCATITASFGAGKTATLRHVVLKMVDEGYDVLLVTHPEDIVKCNNSKKKTLFVIDDLCGTFSINESELEKWDSVINDIEELIQNKFHKIIVACRLQVFEDEKFESLSIFKTTVCNLLSKGLCLSKHERQLIAEMYLETKASDIIQYSNIFDCFPLLCKLYRDNPQLDITNFFQNPSSVYEAEIEQLKKNKHLGKYCALALCVMFNNEFPEAVLMNDINTNTRTIIENTFEACSLDKTTSRLLILNELILLKDTFIKEEHGVFKTVNDKIFNFLFYYFGKEMIKHLIINAHSEFIMERFLLEKEEHTDQLITIVPPRYHHLYIMRMFNDWSQGKVMHVFCNRNMKKTKFRHIYLLFLNILGLSHQKQLAQTCDINNKDTALLQCCFIGDVELVQWCCNQCVDVNMCGFNGMSPLFVSSQKGHTDIVQILLKNKADINRCDDNDASPFVCCMSE